MNKKILLKTLLPIFVVALLGGGIASSLTLTSCSNNKKDYIILNTREGVIEYLNKHQQHCAPENFPYIDDIFGTGHIIDATNYWNFIKEVYNKQAFINTLLFFETIYYDLIWDGTNPEIVIGNNFLITYYYDEGDLFKDEWQIKKWNSIDDCSFSMIYEPGTVRESFNYNSDLTIKEAIISKFPESSENNLIAIDLDKENSFWFQIWSDYPEITYSQASL